MAQFIKQVDLENGKIQYYDTQENESVESMNDFIIWCKSIDFESGSKMEYSIVNSNGA
ncbi:MULTISPECIES: hypothetical protein [Bacillus cereus group]|uniref:hypothetical protein n=1 Tax=Bacillus cereus group TaxID=86661 RepID=UPI0013747245|nr:MULTISPECIES: hypothetical protein [Bacillus cereus group]HDR4683592.1 hypothetical protein [Bacillus cereus]HDR4687045.1 hypothetical protein [Bacillus cereus]